MVCEELKDEENDVGVTQFCRKRITHKDSEQKLRANVIFVMKKQKDICQNIDD